ncbi:MAG: type II toxin-antitoxin system HicA family toxin [Candidatus Aminicenantes bacterium]|nr:type II toxin-antitoxin system HicA family toxin [Candidatus Aminicenantes bacterium]
MTGIPKITGKKVISTLRKAGFEVIRIKGSHHFLRHQDGRCTVVAVHGGETIGRGLMRKILNDCEMTDEEFMKFL